VVLVEAHSGQARTVELDFPEGRAGWTGTGVFWRNPDQLIVATVGTGLPLLSPRPDSATTPPVPAVVAVSVFDADGTLVAVVPIDNHSLVDSDASHAGLMWVPAPLTRGDEILITRRPTERQLQIAAVSLTGDPAGYTPATLELPEHDLTVTHADGSR
jgi:hypothetical protein